MNLVGLFLHVTVLQIILDGEAVYWIVSIAPGWGIFFLFPHLLLNSFFWISFKMFFFSTRMQSNASLFNDVFLSVNKILKKLYWILFSKYWSIAVLLQPYNRHGWWLNFEGTLSCMNDFYCPWVGIWTFLTSLKQILVTYNL